MLRDNLEEDFAGDLDGGGCFFVRRRGNPDADFDGDFDADGDWDLDVFYVKS